LDAALAEQVLLPQADLCRDRGIPRKNCHRRCQDLGRM